jgi:outer membrane protein assembly factor BamD (BamD/ComL family)
MQGKVKLSKRQMKEDKFTTFMLTSKDRLQTELEDKWQYYVIGLVVVVVLIWAAAWYFDRQADLEIEASEALAQAVLAHQSGGSDQLAIMALTQVIDNYGTTAMAEQAVYLLGNLNLGTRNYEEAESFYRRYLSDFSGSKLNRAAAYAGIAAVQEDQGMYAEAAASFVQAAQEYPGGPLEGDYELGAVRNYLAVGDLALAEQRQAVLEENHAGTDWARQATRLLAEHRHGE